ncbi:MAG: hypothetical protein MI923_29095 [Phycisphaerales bacterium]|nr:hypothetical protein [Phycisphaerales bacterium]
MQLEFEVDLKPIQRRIKPANASRNTERLPAIVKLLVLAYQIEQAVEEGRACDYMDVAQQLGLTRARVTQITNLLLLSPTIQATILTKPDRIQHLSERRLRSVLDEVDWQEQEILFQQLLTG